MTFEEAPSAPSHHKNHLLTVQVAEDSLGTYQEVSQTPSSIALRDNDDVTTTTMISPTVPLHPQNSKPSSKFSALLSRLSKALSILQILSLFVGPLLFIPFLFDILKPGHPEISRCAGVIVWISIWWLFEPIDMAVTSFLPFLLYPMVGVLDSKTAAAAYFNDLNFLFVGSYIIALALEKWNIHKRFALIVLLRIGEKPKIILLGFMTLACFLSMWLSNTCTTATLLPMANAILVNLKESAVEAGNQQYIAQVENYSKAVVLGIAYSSTIGGIATLIGTPTNLIFSSQFNALFPKYGSFSFLNWMLFCTPLSYAFLIVCWIVLTVAFVRGFKFGDLLHHQKTKKEQEMGDANIKNVEATTTLSAEEQSEGTETKRRKQQKQEENGEEQREQLQIEDGVTPSNHDHKHYNSVMDIFREEYQRLGKVKIEEVIVLLAFVLMCTLWICRELPINITIGNKTVKLGWALLFFLPTNNPEKAKFISDGTVAVAISILLFIIPSRSKPGHSIIDWKYTVKKLPWGVLFLLGAGYALSKAFEDTKFGQFIADIILKLGGSFPPYLMLFVLSILITFFTEVASNVATASIVLPVIANLAIELGQNPLFYMVPAVLCCSLAFCMPIGTPPYSLAYAYGYLKVKDMVFVGFLLNWLSIGCVVLWTFLLGGVTFGIQLNVVPDWAK